MGSTPLAPKSAGICLTPGCVLAASEILSNLSPRHQEIDPCTDFRTFVCEGWDMNNDLRADQPSAFTGSLMAEKSQLILRHVLESPWSSFKSLIAPTAEINGDVGRLSAERENFEKLQDGYQACMNEEIIQKTGSKPLIALLRKLEELYPTMDSEDDNGMLLQPFEQSQKSLDSEHANPLSEAVLYMNNVGVSPLITLYVGVSL